MDSPFEMRLKMLEMAKNYLDRQYEIATSSYMTMLRQAQDSGTAMTKEFLNSVPKMYDFSKIGELAEQFNAFVSKK